MLPVAKPWRHYCCAFFAMMVACAMSPANAQDQWLVLKNDQIIEGTIQFESQKYVVTTQTGSRIVIPESRVSFVADSVSDIYWDKWSRVDPDDPQSHINLFRWCLKQGMLEEAQKQIDLVAKIESMEDQSNHLSRMARELEVVVQRKKDEAALANRKAIEALNIRRLPPLEPAVEIANIPTIPLTPLDAEGRPMRALEPLPKNSAGTRVALVDFEEDVSSEDNPAATRRDKPAWVSNRQLDRETRALPNGTVNFYKRHIEPKLIENCISCHDSRSVSMPLNKRSFGQTIPRRMSQQNLHFVLQQVDRKDPLNSRLLEMATNAHGNQASAVYTAGDASVFEIKKWMVAVSDDPAKWLMELSQESTRKPDEPITELEPSAAELAELDQIEADQIELKSTEPVSPKEEPAVDPYDPSSFNRK